MTARELTLLVIALQTCMAVSAAVVFRDSPEDLALTAGKTALLRCSVQPQGAESEMVKWLHLETNQILTKDETVVVSIYEERYSVVGNHEADGEYWLKISSVQPSDSGEYRCMYGSVYRSAILTILASSDTGYPLCDVNPDPAEQLPGRISELSCTSHGSHPPAYLIWRRDDAPISDVAQQMNAMQRVVTAEDNGVKFTCTAKTNAATMAASRTCEVMVLKRRPTGLINPETHIVQQGGVATYTCTGDGTPAVSSYSWLVNHMYVTNEDTRSINRYRLLDNNRTLRITDVRRWENGAVIICEVSIASGLTGRAWARLSIASMSVTSAANGIIPGLLFPPIEGNPIENDNRNMGPTVLKPHTNNAKAGVVAGAVLATVGVILALVAIAILLIRTKTSSQFSMDVTNKNKCLQEKSFLPTGTIKKVDECPIYAKPNKLRKGPAPAPPSDTAAPAGELAAQRKKSRKNHHSYEKVDILGVSSPGQACTLPVRLQIQAPEAPDNRRSDTVRFIVKARAPLPPGVPPPPKSPPPAPPKVSPPPTPRHPNDLELVYAELELPARSETINQTQPGVNYAMLQVHNSTGSSAKDWDTNDVHTTSDNMNM